MVESHTYFVRGDDGEEYGPVPLAELREWALENRVGLGTRVRSDSADSPWNAWQQYPELVALLAEVQAVGRPIGLPVLAPWGRRTLAFGVDFILAYVLVLPLVFASLFLMPVELISRMQLIYLGLIDGPPPPFPVWFVTLINLICFLLPLMYYTAFHAAHGRTPAKSMLRIRVVDAAGRKPQLGQALLRALVFCISVYFCLGIPLVYAFFNPQRRALHDIAAGTYVVEQ